MNCAAAFAGKSQDGVDQAVHLADRRLDEADRLVEFVAKRSSALDLPPAAARSPLAHCRASSCRRNCIDALEKVLAQRLELGREAHDVDQRRAQVVADDVGEALDLVVGFLEVGRAVFDDPFEIGVGRLPARARAAPLRGSCAARDRSKGRRSARSV